MTHKVKNIQRAWKWDKKYKIKNLTYFSKKWDQYAMLIILHGDNYVRQYHSKKQKKNKVLDELL